VTDLPLLETVGHPHAVNPDRNLRRIAAERGWPVLDFSPHSMGHSGESPAKGHAGR
jgi:phosphoserine phosphatase